MDEEKKADVIALFADMKAAAAIKQRRLRHRNGAHTAGGTKIINSTIVVCGIELQAVVAQLLSQTQRANKS